MNFFEFAARIGSLSNKITADYPWEAMLPGAIEYAESRIYREIAPVGVTQRTTAGVLTAGSPFFTLPVPAAGAFIVVTSISLITPLSTVLTPVSQDYIWAVWPAGSTPGTPTVWAPFSMTQVLVGPQAASAYQASVTGQFKPAPLSRTNSTTVLTDYFPDLFVAAAMIFISGATPQKGAWESEYGALMMGADVITNRQRWNAESWSSQPPSAIATPPREGK